jgi:abortive infection bacteriophage resistance protein
MEAYQASFFMTKKQNFNKPTLTIQEQISLLESRGMRIDNQNLATQSLRFIGYYRLSGYAHYFRSKNDQYREGTTFEAVLQHYTFDRKLRILLFDAIEHIEVALRNIITLVMTEHYGAFWFRKNSLFIKHIGKKPINGAKLVLQSIREATIEHKNKDVFLRHYYDTYATPDLPPSWIMMETLSMGAVSKMFSLLIVEERKRIAAILQIKERHLLSWMRSLTYIRNLCAHHARIWNRVSTVKVEADKRYAICRAESFQQGKLYSQAAVIAILLEVIDPDNLWEQNLKELLSSFSHPYANDMGFPENWDGFNL